MSKTKAKDSIARLVYLNSTHAPVFRRYKGGRFVEVGREPERGKPWRIDEETGEEIHALGGPNHKYNGDLKVGSSYPKTVFITATDQVSNSLTHEALEEFLEDNGLWSDQLNPVVLPDGQHRGKLKWMYGYQYRPPEQAPYSLESVEDRVTRQLEGAGYELDTYRSPHDLQVWIV